MWKKSTMVFTTLNTKQFCFLCLLPSKTLNNLENQDELWVDKIFNQPVSLRCLRRHLKITGRSFPDKTFPKVGLSEEEVEVKLCKKCEKIMNRFTVLFQQLEKVQMEMDYQLEKIRCCISNGAGIPQRVQKYSKGMTSDLQTLSQLALIDKLRKEISEKCLKNRQRTYPTVELTRVKFREPPQSSRAHVKEEVDQIEDFQEDFHPLEEQIDEAPPKIDLVSHPNPTQTSEPETKPKVQKRYKKYSKSVTTGRYHCNLCGVPFKNTNSVSRHFKVAHSKNQIKCDTCEKTFARLDVFKRHKKTCIGKRRLAIKGVWYTQEPSTGLCHCTKCDKTTKHRKNLIEHYKTFHLGERHKCECGTVIRSLNNFKIHKRKCVFKKEKCLFICNSCGKSFLSSGHFRIHEVQCKNKIKTEPEYNQPG